MKCILGLYTGFLGDGDYEMDIGIVHRFLGDWDFLAAAQEMAKLPQFLRSTLTGDNINRFFESFLESQLHIIIGNRVPITLG